ncbi:hypothetical protein EJA05_14180 [Pseudomonas oryziphila]|uniref:Helix-turn-helix domain-containing protein n=1 Tax=Pseudomonas entomophila TaxID=312306 RepID=A0A3Q8TUY8_9PSED|nr:hypothetical protein EJA05_14180 [Pseudomonas oryziphila]
MRTRKHGLLEWLKTATDEQVARTGTSRAYLRLIAYGHKTASAEMAVKTELASAGAVTRKQLRPDDWSVLWPELVAA